MERILSFFRKRRGQAWPGLFFFVLVLPALSVFPALAQAPLDPEKLVADMDRLMRGTTSYGRYEMIVTAPRWQRTVRMEVWSAKDDRSLVKINYPARDKGITFLRVGNEMWQYVPRIERIIKLPPSMMLQSWMGSDLTNDDLVKESSLVEDYDKRIVLTDGDFVTLELRPHPAAPVVWGRVMLEIDTVRLVPRSALYYDEDDLFIRKVSYQEVKKLAKRYYPMKLVVTSMLPEKQGRSTVFLAREIAFDEPLEENLFSIRSLKELSRY